MGALTGLKGLGAKRIELLNAAGIREEDDLAAFFPIAYYELGGAMTADCARGKAAVRARVVGAPSVRFVRKGLSVARFACEDEAGNTFSVIYYNRPYIGRQFAAGETYYFFGDITEKKGRVMLNPIAERAEDIVPEGFYTVYPTITGIPRAVLKSAIADCLTRMTVRSAVGESLRRTLGFLPLKDAYEILHYPRTRQELQIAERTVAVEETTQLMLMFRFMRANADRVRRFRYDGDAAILYRELRALPYELTGAQQRAIDDLLSDMNSDFRMNRLVQGDVGSGKTIVAFAALRYAALSDRQAALMAPTEILARQHYRKYCEIFGSAGVVILTGGMKAKERREALERIADGSARTVIGTHSLFQTGVTYRNLALVVTDEQHRFGVAQRTAIEEKGAQTDTLIMSATPIPRTMALLVYGELDVSVLDEKPIGRKEILTRFVSAGRISDMYDYLRREAAEDKRSYIVAPRVESGEELVNAAKTLYERLSKYELRDVPMGLLYGGMSEKAKNEALDDFKTGRTKILVSTTVVEVGVDVPEACNMVILDADRFGLSQLHQLRGRVGRGEAQAYCFLTTERPGDSAKERLDYLCGCSDGFRLAEYDLETRGAGDFIGMSQHGYASALCNLRIDKEIIDLSRDLVEQLLYSDRDGVVLKDKYRRIVQNVTLN